MTTTDTPPPETPAEAASLAAVASTPLLGLFVADCIDHLRTIPAESIGAVITDPPFSSGGRQNGQKRTSFSKLEGYNGAPTKWSAEDWLHGDSMGADSFWRSTHELIPVFTKGQPDPMPHGSFYNVIDASPPSNKEHPTMKPTEVLQMLVSATKGIVLDPFCGVGSTCLAAHNLNRPFIGVDIDAKWIDIARRRLSQDVLSLA